MNILKMYVQKQQILMHLLILTVGNKYSMAILVKNQERMLNIDHCLILVEGLTQQLTHIIAHHAVPHVV